MLPLAMVADAAVHVLATGAATSTTGNAQQQQTNSVVIIWGQVGIRETWIMVDALVFMTV